MKEFYRSYLNGEKNLKGKDFIALMCAAAVFGGLFGHLYEVTFYILDCSDKLGEFGLYICKRGTCFGPWIEIYAIGAVFIYLVTHKFRKKPWLVILLAGISCGILEYIAGYAIYNIFDGRRGWNYNEEILSWGGEFTNGFVCVRSVLIFAASGAFLMYAVIPFFIWLHSKISAKLFFNVCIILAAVFLIDVFYNDVIVSIFDTYSAGDLYKNIGWFTKYNEDWLIPYSG